MTSGSGADVIFCYPSSTIKKDPFNTRCLKLNNQTKEKALPVVLIITAEQAITENAASDHLGILHHDQDTSLPERSFRATQSRQPYKV